MSTPAGTVMEFGAVQEGDLKWLHHQEQSLQLAPWSFAQLRDSLEAEHEMTLMGTEDKTVAYAVVLSVLDERQLLRLGVIGAQQRRGFGFLLLQHLLDRAHDEGAASFLLEVCDSNQPALELYEKAGFVTIGQRKAYYPTINGCRQDALVMRRML